MEEIWKDIEGYEGFYQVSNLGRVRSLERTIKRKSTYGGLYHIKGQILKLKQDKGYLRIGLRKNNILKYYSIHRLVAEAFIPNPNKLPCINHKDENKQNNYVNNLEWCTYQYNNNYGTRLDRVSQNNYFSKTILQYSKENTFIKEWKNTRIAIIGNNFFGKEVNNFYTVKRAIQSCCTGKKQTAYGFKWKYK